jgi:hypothetical protein
MGFPEVLEWQDEKLSLSYVLPDEALAEVAMPKAVASGNGGAARLKPA